MRALSRALLAAPLLASACASSSAIRPFTTDGCSLFPDQALIGKSEWCGCCLRHDLAYWRGGTEADRLKADEELRSCVLASSGNAELADLMFSGVRSGGGPYFFTPYRWAYGWEYGRWYAPLTPQEEAQAAALRSSYLDSNPALVCPGDSR